MGQHQEQSLFHCDISVTEYLPPSLPMADLWKCWELDVNILVFLAICSIHTPTMYFPIKIL